MGKGFLSIILVMMIKWTKLGLGVIVAILFSCSSSPPPQQSSEQQTTADSQPVAVDTLDPEGHSHPKNVPPEVLKQLDAVLLLDQEKAKMTKPVARLVHKPDRPTYSIARYRPVQKPPEKKPDAEDVRLKAAFQSYSTNYPSVTWEKYKLVAKGKPEDFCLFKSSPSMRCADYGDVENDNSRKKTAMDGYQAALLSEIENSDKFNIRVFGSLAQLFIEKNNFESADFFLEKILTLNPNNRWAKKKLNAIQP